MDFRPTMMIEHNSITAAKNSILKEKANFPLTPWDSRQKGKPRPSSQKL
jgi:hypothetical protein